MAIQMLKGMWRVYLMELGSPPSVVFAKRLLQAAGNGGFRMPAKIMKWVSMAALVLAAMFWRAATNYELLLQLVVCAGAIVVVMQAVRLDEYRWAAGFVAIALLFNPIVPVFRISGVLWLLVTLVSIAPFAVSLAVLKTQPRLSIASITDRCPGSESL